jgi:lysophospholipase L1-like esterase
MFSVKPALLFPGLTATTIVLATVVTLRISNSSHEVDALSGWLFLCAVAAASTLLLELTLRAVRNSAATRSGVRLLVGTSLALLFAVEATFRYGIPRWATYAERNGGVYVSQFAGKPTWFHTYIPGSPFRFSKTEFTHFREINSLGFTGGEFIAAKAPGEYRILALGDSFTEGLGTSADTTWVRVTEARLGEHYPGRRVTSLNAGVSASDPYFEYMLLKEKLHSFHPDLVIVVINTSDVSEIIVRGGSERFQPDGTVSYSTGPSWERLYGLSYIWRAIVHEVLDYNFLLVKGRDLAARQREAVRLLGVALESIREFCRAHGMDLHIVSHPHRWELQQGSYDVPAYDELMRRLEREPDLRFVDLVKYYAQHGIITAETAPKLYWPLDLHHNTNGYRIMGEAIAANVIEMGLGPGRLP